VLAADGTPSTSKQAARGRAASGRQGSRSLRGIRIAKSSRHHLRLWSFEGGAPAREAAVRMQRCRRFGFASELSARQQSNLVTASEDGGSPERSWTSSGSKALPPRRAQSLERGHAFRPPLYSRELGSFLAWGLVLGVALPAGSQACRELVSRLSRERPRDSNDADISTAVSAEAWSLGLRLCSIQVVQQRQTVGLLSGAEELSMPSLTARSEEPPFCSQAASTLASWLLCTYVVVTERVAEGRSVPLPAQPASATTTGMTPSERVRTPIERMADATAACNMARFTGGSRSREPYRPRRASPA
jgi:hypothetical protein